MVINDYRCEDRVLGISAQFEVQLTAEMLASLAAQSGDVTPPKHG